MTDPPQKTVRAQNLSRFIFRDDAATPKLIQRVAPMPRMRRPQRPMIIPEAAGAFLYVWFLKVHCRSEFRISCIALATNGGNERIGTLATVLFERFQQRVMECLVTCQQPRLNQRGLEVRVGSGSRDAITNRAETVPDCEPRVPEHTKGEVAAGPDPPIAIKAHPSRVFWAPLFALLSCSAWRKARSTTRSRTKL